MSSYDYRTTVIRCSTIYTIFTQRRDVVQDGDEFMITCLLHTLLTQHNIMQIYGGPNPPLYKTFAPRFYNLLHDFTICSTILQFAPQVYNFVGV